MTRWQCNSCSCLLLRFWYLSAGRFALFDTTVVSLICSRLLFCVFGSVFCFQTFLLLLLFCQVAVFKGSFLNFMNHYKSLLTSESLLPLEWLSHDTTWLIAVVTWRFVAHFFGKQLGCPPKNQPLPTQGFLDVGGWIFATLQPSIANAGRNGNSVASSFPATAQGMWAKPRKIRMERHPEMRVNNLSKHVKTTSIRSVNYLDWLEVLRWVQHVKKQMLNLIHDDLQGTEPSGAFRWTVSPSRRNPNCMYSLKNISGFCWMRSHGQAPVIFLQRIWGHMYSFW